MQTDRALALSLRPRFLSAIRALSGPESLRERLAYASMEVLVFADHQLPASLLPQYQELREILDSERYAQPHKSLPATYLHWRRTHRAAELITSLLESIVYMSDGE